MKYSKETKIAEKLLTDMSYDEFQTLIDGYIERTSQQTGEMPASTFFELLFEKLVARTQQTIEITGRIINNQLVLSLPEQKPSSVQVLASPLTVKGLIK